MIPSGDQKWLPSPKITILSSLQPLMSGKVILWCLDCQFPLISRYIKFGRELWSSTLSKILLLSRVIPRYFREYHGVPNVGQELMAGYHSDLMFGHLSANLRISSLAIDVV